MADDGSSLEDPPAILPRTRFSLDLPAPKFLAKQRTKPRVSFAAAPFDFSGYRRTPRVSLAPELRLSLSHDQVASAIASSEAFRQMKDHSIPLEDLLVRLKVHDINQGLMEKQASSRLLEDGENVLTQKATTPWYVLFVRQLVGFFSLLLWTGSILSFIAYELTDDPQNLYLSVVIALVVLLTALISFYQEAKSRAIMESFKNFTPPKCTVLREGVQYSIRASRLVRGDVVLLKAGDRIPADLRIIQSYDMKVENAALTGESEHLPRTTECTHPDNPLDTQNLAFLGTLCVDGTGAGVVINTGDKTFMGRIAHLAQVAESDETTLSKEIGRFIKMISFVAFSIGFFFFVLGALQGHSVLDCVIYMIGIIVANVPEGLLATVTVGLTLTAKRMAGKNVLVKNLESVETLGSTTCICSDKTGTLTQNSMSVVSLWFDQKLLVVPAGDLGPAANLAAYSFEMLHRCAVLCNEAVFDMGIPQSVDVSAEDRERLPKEVVERLIEEKRQQYLKSLQSKPYSQRPTTSSASEGALIKFFQLLTPIEVTRERQDFLYYGDRKVCVPFNSTAKFQVSVHVPAPWQPQEQETSYLLLMKGAPEIVLSKCDSRLEDGRVEAIDEAWNQAFIRANSDLGSRGERVMGFAYSFLPAATYTSDFDWEVSPPNFPTTGLTFIGLIGLQDPPRDGVPEAVRTCQQAGIKVIMVTGDQPVTATAIARQCNIITKKTANEVAQEKGLNSFEDALDDCDAVVIHGSVLAQAVAEDRKLPESARGARLKRWLLKPEVVFARTTPAQKLIIVEGNQKLGHIVAVTGDGVNDSPAIKKADIGIAMNIVGSDVAKDAADMLLLDDNFESIISGVEEGRLIFDNLKKSIVYTLASNIPELGPFLSFIVFQFPLPLTIILVLFVDLCTDMLPAISLAYEAAEADIMQRKPRNAEVDHLVTWKLLAFGYAEMGIIEMFAGFYAYFVVMHDYGFSVELLFGLALERSGAQPLPTDAYSAADEHRGNSQWDNPAAQGKMVDWVSDECAVYDLRVWLWNSGPWLDCLYEGNSDLVAGAEVCYGTEALKAAQTAFFLAIVAAQFVNLLCLKTRTQSLWQHRQNNAMAWYGIAVEIAIGLAVTYIPVLNRSLSTRPLQLLHLFLPAAPFCLALLVFDEVRKLSLRSYKSGWLAKFTLW